MKDIYHIPFLSRRAKKTLENEITQKNEQNLPIYLSADMINRKIDDVNCVIDVETMYALHIVLPKVHSPKCIVVIRNGMPIRKHWSAIAKFKMYIFVTVCILLKRNTT